MTTARASWYLLAMPRKAPSTRGPATPGAVSARPSGLVDTRIIYCGDCLDQLRKLPDACVDLIYIDPPFNSNRNHDFFWGEPKEKRAFEDRHASTQACIECMPTRFVGLALLSCAGFPAGSSPARINRRHVGKRVREASQ